MVAGRWWLVVAVAAAVAAVVAVAGAMAGAVAVVALVLSALHCCRGLALVLGTPQNVARLCLVVRCVASQAAGPRFKAHCLQLVVLQ